MKMRKELTYSSILKFIKNTNEMYDGKDAEGKAKYKQLREKQISINDLWIKRN